MAANPFLSLFSSEEDAEAAVQAKERQNHQMNQIIARVLLVKGGSDQFVDDKLKYFLLLSDEGVLTFDNYEKILAKRLQLSNPENYLVINPRGSEHNGCGREHAIESSPVLYLSQCYDRIGSQAAAVKKAPTWKVDLLSRLKKKVVEMAGVMICSAHNICILQAKDVSESQFVHHCMDSCSKGLTSFILDIARSQTRPNLEIIFNPLLSHVYARCSNLTLMSSDYYLLIEAVMLFTQVSSLSSLLVSSSYWFPDKTVPHNGKAYQAHTLLGRLLSPTTLSPSLMQPSEHFIHNFMQSKDLTRSLQLQLEGNVAKLHILVSSLLRQGEDVKERVIEWFVSCFKANADRGKMMSRMFNAPMIHTASDGFFLNVCWVLLHLSTPFTIPSSGSAVNPKLMNVDPGYCVLGSTRDGHEGPQYDKAFLDFSQETKLTSREILVCPSEPVLPVKFVSHCFFLTHKSLILGLTQTIHLFKHIHRILATVQEMEGRGGPRERLFLSQLLGVQAHIMHPQLLELSMKFYTATAVWLIELIKKESEQIFPIPELAPVSLLTIPECLVENLSDFAVFLTQIRSRILLESSEVQYQLVTFCTVYMGYPQLIANPHLRAKLTQLLSLMIETDDTEQQGLMGSSFVDDQRALFEQHEIAIRHLFPSLLMIFIDIEHTGDSMEFEDKFQYRLPMYRILSFLWNIPCYRQSLKELSDEVDTVQISSQVPLFLRFMNMIINDATIQLDEGLQNLSVVREIQLIKESPSWEDLSNDEKKDHNERLKEAVMYARNRNILALKTVNTIEMITSGITRPFVIQPIVDQIVAMLNNSLKQLVGQKRKDFNVKDREKYNFDPKALVSSIISVYNNLGKEVEFCQAVPRDERSFSIELFDMTLNVARRLNLPYELCDGLVRMRHIVAKYQAEMDAEEKLTSDAPDEFLDPLMGTIMNDPVTLPTSGNVVDRTVIMRHLLSDQNDPFNRHPLTVEMLQPNDELRQKIIDWKHSKQ
ncbi:PREDICTED: ubiquitin conjugation factor E4 A-like [Amphimedon queenslandica]|uniref:Ubiquitin conjugation factor E4 A n=1 Tax=Amphimedon queenslandica TaxID=400682 RepID=A0A1X7UGQ2_AMPQE|nr:PREDICTED: ubiquitin conjugation factor E4 A-like [Amphimedon queenslandica]|eukprot:XP_011405143.2 PREDICTED: ubiquitin conjugation factor E4 A-like [Amphimedon queenslandica]